MARPGNPNNLIVAATRLSVYLCPSDPSNGELVNYTDGRIIRGICRNPDLRDLGMTNLVGITDSNNFFCATYAFKQLSEADGVMANIGACKIAEILDGTSNTLMIGEITNDGPGLHQGRPWAFWALSSTGQGINGPIPFPAAPNRRRILVAVSIRITGCQAIIPAGAIFCWPTAALTSSPRISTRVCSAA